MQFIYETPTNITNDDKNKSKTSTQSAKLLQIMTDFWIVLLLFSFTILQTS